MQYCAIIWQDSLIINFSGSNKLMSYFFHRGVVSDQRKPPRLLPFVEHGQVFPTKPKFVETCHNLNNLRVNARLNIAQNEWLVNLFFNFFLYMITQVMLGKCS